LLKEAQYVVSYSSIEVILNSQLDYSYWLLLVALNRLLRYWF